jgi:hypothetical protein
MIPAIHSMNGCQKRTKLHRFYKSINAYMQTGFNIEHGENKEIYQNGYLTKEKASSQKEV